MESGCSYRPYERLLQSFGNIEVARGWRVSPEPEAEHALRGLNEWSGVQYDEGIHTHWFSYKEPAVPAHVQLEDPRSLAYKLALIGNQPDARRRHHRLRAASGSWQVLADYRDLVISEPEARSAWRSR